MVSGTNLGGAVLQPLLQAYDAAGTRLSLHATVDRFESGFGSVGALAIGASGRIWWNLRFRDLPPSLELPYLLVLHE